jgi:hypothetical protein
LKPLRVLSIRNSDVLRRLFSVARYRLAFLLQGENEAVLFGDSEANIRQPVYQKLVLVLSDQPGMSFQDNYVGLSKNLKFVTDQIVLLTLNVTHQRKFAKLALPYKPAELNCWHRDLRFCAKQFVAVGIDRI